MTSKFIIISIDDVRGCQKDSIQGAIRFWGNTDRVNIFNNTIYVSDSHQIGTPSCISFEGSHNDEVMAFNNIFKTTSGIAMIRPHGANEYDPSHIGASSKFVGNCYDNSDAPLVISTDDTNGHYQLICTPNQWHAVGQEKIDEKLQGVFGDAGLASPLHVSLPATDAFKLLPNSPCRGRAIDVEGMIKPVSKKPGEMEAGKQSLDLGAQR